MADPGDHSFPTSEGPVNPGPLGTNPIAEGKKVIIGDEFEVLRYNNYRNLLNAVRWDQQYRMATLNQPHALMERAATFIQGWNTKLRVLARMQASTRFKW